MTKLQAKNRWVAERVARLAKYLRERGAMVTVKGKSSDVHGRASSRLYTVSVSAAHPHPALRFCNSLHVVICWIPDGRTRPTVGVYVGGDWRRKGKSFQKAALWANVLFRANY